MKQKLLFTLLLILGISLCSNVFAQTNVTLGEGTSFNTTTGPPTPYGTYWKNFRQQYLVRATELENIGGGAGNINSIAFNVSAVNTCSPMPNYKISMKQTTLTALTTTFETGTYQEVFAQNNFVPVVGWNTHTFSTPFNWDGTSNIIVEIVTDLIPGTYTQNASVFYSTTTFNSSLRFQDDTDPANASTTGIVGMNRSNIRFNMATLVVTEPPNPAVLVSPADNAIGVMTSATLNWSSGGGLPTNYKVYFGTVTPPPFLANTTETSYTPTLALTTQYYWQIVPENANGLATNCPIWNFQTGGPVVLMTTGTQAITDGQTFSFLDSGGATGQYQNSESYTFTFTAANPNSTIFVSFQSFATESGWDFLKIYNGADITAPQIGPALGYSGTTVPADIIGSNAITFVFTSDGSGTFDGWAATVSAVNLAHDLGIMGITGNLTPTVNTQTSYTVQVKNMGNNAEAIYTVKLMKQGGLELASVAGVSIAPQQVLDVVLNWTPTVVEPTSVWATVTLADDAIAQNNESAHLNVSVMEAGQTVVQVGSGELVNSTTGTPTPYGTFYKNFRQQYLYTASDIYAAGGAPGLITALAFNVSNVNTCSAMPNYTIRVKQTNQTVLTTTFEVGDYTTVWTNPSFLPVVDWNIHTFITPFFWDGASNLLVDIVSDIIPGTYTQNASVFHTTTTGASALRFQSDTLPANEATTGTTAVLRANVRFFLVIEDMGSLTGTVTSGGSPLAGAAVTVQNSVFATTSAANGTYNLPYVPIGNQVVSVTKHGYNVVNHNVTIIEDQAVTQDFALTLLPQVSITGRVVGSDAPTVGLAGATIALSGYEPYTATTNATGDFTITGVFASQTYNYAANATGYAAATGTVVVGTTNVNMGNVIVAEMSYPPYGVVATEAANFTNVALTWQAPNPGAVGITEGFEGTTFPPTDWSQIITDTGAAGTTGVTPTWCRVGTIALTPPVPAHGGEFQTAMWWSYSHQDEWLMTPQFTCPGSATLNFWSYVFYGSVNNDHYYVKVSTNGGTDWTVLWDATTLTGGQNAYTTPISIDLSAYAGQQIKLAWHADDPNTTSDGMWYVWFMDDISIAGPSGLLKFSADQLTSAKNAEIKAPVSYPTLPASRALVANPKLVEPNLTVANSDNDRTMLGYKVWRLLAANQANETLWTSLTTAAITPTNYTDNAWQPLPSGVYKYAVKSVYTNNVMSTPAFSNEIHKGMMGTLTGTVLEFNTNIPVAGATVTAGEYSGVTNATGVYSFAVYAGTYTVTCAKASYQTATQAGVVITGMQTTTQNFVMTEITLPAAAVQAAVAGNNVNVTWMAPGTGGGEWLSYDGDNDDSIGTGGAADFDVAIRFPATVMADYAGMSLYSVKVWPAQAGSFSARVWTGGTATAPGPMVADQAFTPELDVYNTVALTTPVAITGSEELWFGYRCNVTTGFPAGCDAGPGTDGFGNMMYYQGAWSTLLALAEIDGNWNIQGYVGYSAPTNAPELTIINGTLFAKTAHPAEYSGDRALTGYKVWRLLQGQETNETAWTSLTADPITATAYPDNGWGPLPDGTYKWSVKAVYTGGALSIPAFSNAIPKYTQIGTIAGIVRNTQNQAIAGATVTAGEITATTNASGAYSMTVLSGTHTVVASHPNYSPVTQTGVIVVTGNTTTVNFQLPASENLLVDGFETYTNFALEFAPWTLVDVDLSATYGMTGITWTNAYAPMAYIIFNPSATTPPVTDMAPHGGDKMACCFASTTAVNNDWMITPQLTGATQIKFWAKSYSAQYIESFKVGISTTGTAPTNFTIISGATAIQPPTTWTEYIYPLSYGTTPIRIGIQCVSDDKFVFCVDDVTVEGASPNEDPIVPVIATELKNNYPNPFNPETTISFSVKEAAPVTLEIYNVKGQLVKTLVNNVMDAGNHSAVWNGMDNNGRSVASGMYYYKMNAGKYSSTKKMVLMK